MSVLGIYGASGLGREILELASIINAVDERWSQCVFIDDGDVPSVVSGCNVYKYDEAKTLFGSALEIVMGIGEPATREKLFKRIERDGIPTPTLIHPDVYIPKSTTVGKGVVIQSGCFVSCNAIICDYVFIQPQCNIGHDDVIEEGCILAGFSNIGGIVHIGKYTYIGLSSAVKQTVNIGHHSIIGMGSMVHKEVPDEVIVMGNPARTLARNIDKKVFGH